MIVKKIIFILTFVVILMVITMVVNRNLHVIKYCGVILKMPFPVSKKIYKNSIYISRIPPDGTLLTINNKNIDFNEYKSIVVEKSKISKLIEKKNIDLKDNGQIILLVSKLNDSSQLLVIDGYIEKKKLLFTFSGNSDSANKFYSSLKIIDFYQ